MSLPADSGVDDELTGERRVGVLFPKTYQQADVQAIEFLALVSQVPRLPKPLGLGRGKSVL
jgi:hypothetical protein